MNRKERKERRELRVFLKVLDKDKAIASRTLNTTTKGRADVEILDYRAYPLRSPRTAAVFAF